MWTDMVKVLTPGFDHDAGLLAASEPFERQALIAELAVEALVVAVLPGFARIDVRGVDARVGEPGEDRVADELRAVVRAQETRCAARRDEPGQNLDHTARANGTGHVNRQALAGELIDHRQALDLLAARAGVEHEVVGPDVIGAERGQRPRP